jgi:hypothetical protein
VRLAVVAAAALILGACGGNEEAASTRAPATWNACTNGAFGFTIEYPPEWHTTPVPRGGGECLFFEPEPFEIPEDSDFTGTAIEVLPAQESYANVVAGLTDERFARVLARSETTIAGRDAVRIEAEATGEGLLDAGTRTYAYVIDRGGRALIVQTTEAAGTDFGERKRVLDRAARSLRFAGP